MFTPPAAFGRLCVETLDVLVTHPAGTQPPSGGCVLKPNGEFDPVKALQPAAFGRLCVETLMKLLKERTRLPAAFGRLCVETPYAGFRRPSLPQPPSGGCVLKPRIRYHPCTGGRQPPSGGCVLKPFQPCQAAHFVCQPPSGGCVLKQLGIGRDRRGICQPPSGGCVLKPPRQGKATHQGYPAAFGRLCVET